MVCCKAKLKSSGVKASPCFKPFLIGNMCPLGTSWFIQLTLVARSADCYLWHPAAQQQPPHNPRLTSMLNLCASHILARAWLINIKTHVFQHVWKLKFTYDPNAIFYLVLKMEAVCFSCDACNFEILYSITCKKSAIFIVTKVTTWHLTC